MIDSFSNYPSLWKTKILTSLKSNPDLLFTTNIFGKTLFEVAKWNGKFPGIEEFAHSQYIIALYSVDIGMLQKFLQLPDFRLEMLDTKIEIVKKVAISHPCERNAEGILDLAIAKGAFHLLHELVYKGYFFY